MLEGPTSAGMIVSTAQRGGTFREAFAIARTFAEARKQHGDSALLDEIVSAKPEIDRTRAHSPEEVKQHGLERIREAIALVEQKASPEEVEDYRRFVISLAERVAAAKIGGRSAAERGRDGRDRRDHRRPWGSRGIRASSGVNAR